MSSDALVTFATAMFAILNPVGSVAIFAGMVAAGLKGVLPGLAGMPPG